MKIQRSTAVLAAIAVIFGATVLILETQRGNDPVAAPVEGANQPLFAFEEADVTGLHIETRELAVTFVRGEDALWQMTEPESVPAEEAAIAFLLSRLTSDGLLKTVTVDAAARAEFGLDVPTATVDITLADGTTHRLVLGGGDFSGTAYYALVDPAQVPLPADAGAVPVAVVPVEVLSAVERPLEEWKAVVDAPADPEAPGVGEPPTQELPLPDAEEPAPAAPPQ